ncbi:hypothetical protein EHF33_11540 [Deinococcus psychrotolerans]|uniref:Uncharacterized protein n=1 Tax=Deinococcus psychrotolerans TaxID=2489213 RepID=A0A3G8YGI3_9DEIO|nr:hypothetical protein [Deinococcus psychrotolerans]AZI43297.1 hypothetical protein EHF33_11540 [Deinococcus psychrotolerans]
MTVNEPAAFHLLSHRRVCFVLVSAALVYGAAQAESATTKTTAVNTAAPMSWQAVQQQDDKNRVKIGVTFDKVDADGYIILKYGSVMLKTRLAGVKVRTALAGVLNMYVPEGARIQAEIVEKGKIQSVLLWKNGKNLNEQLMMDGVAVGIR